MPSLARYDVGCVRTPMATFKVVVLMGLASVRMNAESCRRCALADVRSKVVFGGVDGYRGVRADLMLVGEGPGAEEDAKGIPFVGTAGLSLEALLRESGLERKSAYITNVVKCRPAMARDGQAPSNRAPEPHEIASCWEYLDSQIALVRPQVIVALGVTATVRLLGPHAQVGTSRGRGHFHGAIPVVATYHPSPSSLNRRRGRREMVLDDFALVRDLLGESAKAIPAFSER